MAEAKKAFIERLFATHHGGHGTSLDIEDATILDELAEPAALQAFSYRRIRHQADATDLAQEVYARMLRVKNPDAIRDLGHSTLKSTQRGRSADWRSRAACSLARLLATVNR